MTFRRAANGGTRGPDGSRRFTNLPIHGVASYFSLAAMCCDPPGSGRLSVLRRSDRCPTARSGSGRTHRADGGTAEPRDAVPRARVVEGAVCSGPTGPSAMPTGPASRFRPCSTTPNRTPAQSMPNAEGGVLIGLKNSSLWRLRGHRGLGRGGSVEQIGGAFCGLCRCCRIPAGFESLCSLTHGEFRIAECFSRCSR